MEPVFLTSMLAFIACDEDECLHLFTTPPDKGFFNWESNGCGHCFDIDESYCEALGIDVPTWDDEEPIEVEIDIHISKHEDDDSELDESREPTEEQIDELKEYLNDNYNYLP